jgi:crotonobetainyl-CoA:carnitine CoA-transferase CaiB-like acyl-CoA transferase
MTEVLKGIRVLEVASWGFVPSTGAALADWGADVIKVEPAKTGDPMRGLMTMGLMPGGGTPTNFMFEFPNRGKKSVGIDISTPEGHELLMQLVESSDVFLTSYLPNVRAKLKIDVEDVRARNPKIIYARGSGHGPLGPDADQPGYDSVSFWARGGIGLAISPPDLERPLDQRTPAFGDLIGGLSLAGGIAAAVAGRALGNEPETVDVSLQGMAAWILQPLIAASAAFGLERMPSGPRHSGPNPLVGSFNTQDGRTLTLNFLQPDRYWDHFLEVVDRKDLGQDPRFVDSASRAANHFELGTALDELFAARPLAQWREILSTLDAPWAVMQTLTEIVADPQVIANGYVKSTADGAVTMTPNPIQINSTSPEMRRAPELGQDTELLLMEMGLEWDRISELKEKGVIN